MRLLLFVLAVNEEAELEKTVRGLQAACSPEHVAGIVLLLAQRASEGCLRTAQALTRAGFPIPTEISVQASRDIPACIKTVLNDGRDVTHMLIAFADYCMDPNDIAGLVARAAKDPGAIHKFSRALPGGTFSPEYRPGELPLYRLFSLGVRALFLRRISDPVFQVIVTPARLFRAIRFRQASMAFGIEWVCTLLRMRVPVAEYPVVSLPRTGPDYPSHNRHRRYYLPAVFRARFAPKKSIWEASAASAPEGT